MSALPPDSGHSSVQVGCSKSAKMAVTFLLIFFAMAHQYDVLLASKLL
jgi:hypothetical protein